MSWASIASADGLLYSYKNKLKNTHAMLQCDSLFSCVEKGPHLFFLCGCDGAGKTTLWEQLCTRPALHEIPIIDVNKLSEKAGVGFLTSGRMAVEKVKTLLIAQKTFMRESTLSSHHDFAVLRRAKQCGYMTELIFIGVCNGEIALKRIRQRDAGEREKITPEIVRRHFERGIANLALAIDLFDRVSLFDNTSLDFKLFARFEGGSPKLYTFCPAWFRGIQKEKGYRFTGVYD